MPAPTIRANITGLAEAERNLLELAREYGPGRARRTLTTPLNRAIAPVLDQIQTETPVDTGRLRESVRRRTGAANRFERMEFPDAVAATRVGWFWAAGNSQWFQALAVEFGQPRQGVGGQRILRNALENNIDEVIRIFSRELGPQIERTAERLGRRNRR